MGYQGRKRTEFITRGAERVLTGKEKCEQERSDDSFSQAYTYLKISDFQTVLTEACISLFKALLFQFDPTR